MDDKAMEAAWQRMIRSAKPFTGENVLSKQLFEAGWKAALESAWVPIRSVEDLPKEILSFGRLVQIETSYGQTRIIRGEYYPQFTVENNGDSDASDCDYDAVKGVYYFSPGWYEYCDTNPNDLIYPVDGKAVAWMPLPAPYKEAETNE